MCWVAWGMFRMNASRTQTNHTGTQQGKAGGHNTNRGNTVEREMQVHDCPGIMNICLWRAHD